MNENKSDVERFFEAVAAKLGVQRKWSDLHPVQQMQIVQAINMILQVVHD